MSQIQVTHGTVTITVHPIVDEHSVIASASGQKTRLTTIRYDEADLIAAMDAVTSALSVLKDR